MRRFLPLIALTFSLALGACSGMKTHTEVEALNEAKVTGSPFTQRLATEYKTYVKGRQRAMDYSDAKHFARKGLLAAQGKAVMPEPLNNWHLDDSTAKTVGAARVRLLQALDAGGRSQAPAESALAQTKFDCWIEQAEQSWTSVFGSKAACQMQFENAMNDLETRMKKAVPKSDKLGQAVPAKQLPPAAPMPPVKMATLSKTSGGNTAGLDEGMFLIFFDFNKSALNQTGTEIVNSVARQAKTRDSLSAVTVIGHADTVGSDKYNQRLSLRRAQSVKDALVKRGVSAPLLQVSGRGEKELMVQTPNNTREPANRRVQVSFE